MDTSSGKRSATANAKVDSWSVGVILLECLEGPERDSYRNHGTLARIQRLQETARDPEFGLIMEYIAKKLLEVDPDDRTFVHELDLSRVNEAFLQKASK